MKTLLPALQAHLDGGATTLAWCWRIERSDGVVFGFTDHDILTDMHLVQGIQQKPRAIGLDDLGYLGRFVNVFGSRRLNQQRV